MPRHIGEYYKYWAHPQLFKLIKVEGWRYYFACGHKVTDSVFEDLVRVKTGIAVYKEPVQLQFSY